MTDNVTVAYTKCEHNLFEAHCVDHPTYDGFQACCAGEVCPGGSSILLVNGVVNRECGHCLGVGEIPTGGALNAFWCEHCEGTGYMHVGRAKELWHCVYVHGTFPDELPCAKVYMVDDPETEGHELCGWVVVTPFGRE